MEDPKAILKTLDMLAQLELAISEFYQTCADSWKGQKDFWSSLAVAERKHSQYVREIADLFSKNPKNFYRGRPFQVAAVSTVISGIKNNIQKLKGGELKEENLLFIALDIEESLLESKYFDFLKSDDPRLQNIVIEIMSQTRHHKEMLVNKIGEWKKGKPA
jgi:hypothetical protein